MVTVRERNGGIARVFVGLTLLASVTGCYDVKSVDPGILVLPDKYGLVDKSKNPLGIQGQWFAYGDRYDTQSCLRFGMHGDACSQVYWPPPDPTPTQCPGSDIAYTTFPLKFPNQDGVMCTEGQIGLVMTCDMNTVFNCTEGFDYSNMWGAGIGLDFNLDTSKGVRDPTERGTWNAEAHGIAGVAFDLQLMDDGDLGGPALRVEFPIIMHGSDPTQTLTLPPDKGAVSLNPCADKVGPGGDYPDSPPPSEEHPDGSPFWDAPPVFKTGITTSPVHTGHNEIRWSEVNPAPQQSDYAFQVNELLGIQFHVPSYKGSEPDQSVHFGYGFCISNLTFLRE